MRFLIVATLLGTMCTPGATAPGSTDASVDASTPAAPPAPTSKPRACPAARQHLVEMGCPPAEDYFGEWETTCATKPNGQFVASCILSKNVCSDARECEE